MRFINALLAMAATALAMAGVASAAPSVSFTWTATSGLGTPGSDSITAAVGDTLTLQMHITPDANHVTFAGLSFDPNTLGLVGAHTQNGVGSINTDIPGDIYSTQRGNLVVAPASYTGPGLAFLTGTGVTCPAGLGNLVAGVCGTFPVFSSPLHVGALLPDGTIGTFSMGALGAPGISGTFTLAEAQLEVVPEPATGGLLALGLSALAFIGRRRALQHKLDPRRSRSLARLRGVPLVP